MLEVLLLALLALAVGVLLYRRAAVEYNILQRDYEFGAEYGSLVAERAPLVLRHVPDAWTAGWTLGRAAQATWPVYALRRDGGGVARTTLAEWLHAPCDAATLGPPLNGEDLAAAAGLRPATDLAAALRPAWRWLPGDAAVGRVTAHVIAPGAVEGLRRTTAEATVYVATGGPPVRLWLCLAAAAEVRGRLPDPPDGVDPWSLTSEAAPWAMDLRYVELILRPGHALVLPPHMYVAAAAPAGSGTLQGDGAWLYTVELHGPVSFLATAFRRAPAGRRA